MEKTELHIQWERRIEDYESSGHTQATWCSINKVNVNQLKYWIRKIKGPKRNRSTKSKFTPVVVTEPPVNESMEIKIGQASIEVQPGFNPSFLADIVRTLKTLC
jgi:hypothetical protein